MFFAILVACAQPQIIEEPAWDAAHQDCQPDFWVRWKMKVYGGIYSGQLAPSADCRADIQNDFGIDEDPRLWGIYQAAWFAHVYDLDGAERGFYDYAAARIDVTTVGTCPSADAVACMHGRELIVQDTDYMPGLDGLSVMVHEARHVDPDAPKHVECDGVRMCDRDWTGAYASQIEVYEAVMHVISEDPTTDSGIFLHVDEAIGGLESRILDE